MDTVSLVLLNIDIIYFENKYKNEIVPLKKYFYWESLNECYKRLGECK